MSVFTARIQSIGPEAELFKEKKMAILLGKDTPGALADYCYNIEVQLVTEAITDKQTSVIDEQIYQITAIGRVVLTNLGTLGHITIKFDGATTPELPGALYVKEKVISEITVGTTVIIL